MPLMWRRSPISEYLTWTLSAKLIRTRRQVFPARLYHTGAHKTNAGQRDRALNCHAVLDNPVSTAQSRRLILLSDRWHPPSHRCAASERPCIGFSKRRRIIFRTPALFCSTTRLSESHGLTWQNLNGSGLHRTCVLYSCFPIVEPGRFERFKAASCLCIGVTCQQESRGRSDCGPSRRCSSIEKLHRPPNAFEHPSIERCWTKSSFAGRANEYLCRFECSDEGGPWTGSPHRPRLDLKSRTL